MNNNTLNYADIFRAELTRRSIVFREKEIPSGVRFTLNVPGDNFPSLSFQYFVEDNGQITILSYPATGIPPQKRDNFLSLCNTLNRKMRFSKFFLDCDGDLCGELEFIVYEADEAQLARQMMKMLALAMAILDDCIPEILPLLWSREEREKEEQEKEALMDDLVDALIAGLKDIPDTDSN